MKIPLSSNLSRLKIHVYGIFTFITIHILHILTPKYEIVVFWFCITRYSQPMTKLYKIFIHKAIQYIYIKSCQSYLHLILSLRISYLGKLKMLKVKQKQKCIMITIGVFVKRGFLIVIGILFVFWWICLFHLNIAEHAWVFFEVLMLLSFISIWQGHEKQIV